MSDIIKNVRLKDKDGNILHPEVTVDAELNDTSENPVQNKVIKAALDNKFNEVFQSVSNGKQLLETAITDMGGTVSKVGEVATYNEIKKGLSTLSPIEINLFVQENEPETKYGLWLKTSNSYNDITSINGSEGGIVYTKMTDIPYEFYYSSGSVVVNNDIYLISGVYNSPGCQKLYKYSINDNTYTSLKSIPAVMYKGTSVAIGTDIFIIGGIHGMPLVYNYKYDTLTDTYTKMTNIPYGFYNGSAVSIGSDIYLLGGEAIKTNNYKYDTLTDTYTQNENIPYNFYNGSAVNIGNNIYLLGGYDSKKINYRIEIPLLDKNAIVFTKSGVPFRNKVKMYNTQYGVLNYINFDSVIMTDENGNNRNVEVYIGDGTSWNKI